MNLNVTCWHDAQAYINFTPFVALQATVSDTISWDTSCQHYLFPSHDLPAPLNVVYRSSVTKSVTSTLRGKEEAEVRQQLSGTVI